MRRLVDRFRSVVVSFCISLGTGLAGRSLSGGLPLLCSALEIADARSKRYTYLNGRLRAHVLLPAFRAICLPAGTRWR